MQALDNYKLDIAITGESGSGKSSFINAIRRLGFDDKEAAPTGVVETFTKPTMYLHPKFSDVRLWDLPGIGGSTHSTDAYPQKVNFDQYDFFLLVASERFRDNHKFLANEIQKRKKHFYFVRSKIDNDLRSEERRHTFNEATVLEEIKWHSAENLRIAGVADSQVFLISSLDTKKFDFLQLEKTLENELPGIKRHGFILFLTKLVQESKRCNVM